MIPPDLILHDIYENELLTRQNANEQDLIDFVFEKPFDLQKSLLGNRSIVCPLNDDTFNINDKVLNQRPGIYQLILYLNIYIIVFENIEQDRYFGGISTLEHKD